MVDEATIKNLFSNISEILPVNQKLKKLIDEQKNASKDGIFEVGEIFMQIASSFSIYTEYCINHPVAVKTLEKCRQSKEFANFEKKLDTNPETKFIGLAGFLIKVQNLFK